MQTGRWWIVLLSAVPICEKDPDHTPVEIPTPEQPAWLANVGDVDDQPGGRWQAIAGPGGEKQIILDIDKDGTPEGTWSPTTVSIDLDRDGQPELSRTISAQGLSFEENRDSASRSATFTPALDGTVQALIEIESSQGTVQYLSTYTQTQVFEPYSSSSYIAPGSGIVVIGCEEPEQIVAEVLVGGLQTQDCLEKMDPAAAYDLEYQMRRHIVVQCGRFSDGRCGWAPGTMLRWATSDPLAIHIDDRKIAADPECGASSADSPAARRKQVLVHELLHYVYGDHWGKQGTSGRDYDPVENCVLACLTADMLVRDVCRKCSGDWSGASDEGCFGQWCMRCKTPKPNCVRCGELAVCSDWNNYCLECNGIERISSTETICLPCGGREAEYPAGSDCCESWGIPPGATHCNVLKNHLWDWKVCTPPNNSSVVRATPGMPWCKGGTCECQPR